MFVFGPHAVCFCQHLKLKKILVIILTDLLMIQVYFDHGKVKPSVLCTIFSQGGLRVLLGKLCSEPGHVRGSPRKRTQALVPVPAVQVT